MVQYSIVIQSSILYIFRDLPSFYCKQALREKKNNYYLLLQMKAKEQPKQFKHKARWVKELTTINQLDKKDFDFLDFQSALKGPIAIIILHGPPGSPYEGYSFRIQYDGTEIPYRPPVVRFLDIPWSPFIDQNTGQICCDILLDSWSPALTLRTAILSISSLLCQTKLPEKEPGLNIQAAAEMTASYARFFDTARQYASQHHYTQGHHYKDEQKPPALHPEEPKIEDEQLEEKKEKFVNDSENIEKRNKKIKKLQNTSQFYPHAKKQPQKKDDHDDDHHQFIE